MKPENAASIQYDLAEAAGQKVLFTPLRIDRATVPDGFYCYDLRHADNDSIACTIENNVLVNYFGTILSEEPFDFGKNDYIELEDSIDFLSVPKTTLQEFMEENQPEKSNISNREIRVLIVEPGKAPYESTTANTLEGFQGIVGGSIEYVGLDENTGLFCNEEGKLLGLAGNRNINGDIIAGAFLICGDDGCGDNASLTAGQMAYYSERFAEPEHYTDARVQDALYYEVKGCNSPENFLDLLLGGNNEENEDDLEQ